MFFGRLTRCARILLADADFNDFHSVLGFSLRPVRCVTDDFQGFSLRLFVRDRACFCLRIQNNKILRGPCFRNRRCHRKSSYAGGNRNRFHVIFLGTLFKPSPAPVQPAPYRCAELKSCGRHPNQW